MGNHITSESGEEINLKEADALATRVRKLSPSKIDELWFRFSATETNLRGNKALSTNSLTNIITDQEFATQFVVNLLKETGKSGSLKDLKARFMKNLRDLESNKKPKTKNIIYSESGEKISLKEAEELARRTRKLSAAQIDELWFMTGWIEKDSGNKSLPQKKLNKIIENQDFATSCIIDLLQECGRLPGSLAKLRNNFIKNLEKVEAEFYLKELSKNKSHQINLFLAEKWASAKAYDKEVEGEICNDVELITRILNKEGTITSTKLTKMIETGVRATDGTPFTGIEISLDRKSAKELFDILDREVAKILGNPKLLDLNNPPKITSDIRAINNIRTELLHKLGMLSDIGHDVSSNSWRR